MKKEKTKSKDKITNLEIKSSKEVLQKMLQSLKDNPAITTDINIDEKDIQSIKFMID